MTIRAAIFAACALSFTAQAQQFQTGQLFHVTNDLENPGGPLGFGGVATIFPGGTGWSTLYGIQAGSLRPQGATFDPFRLRIVLFQTGTGFLLIAADGSASTIPLGSGLSTLAARGDGIIYAMPLTGSVTPISVLTPADTLPRLLNQTGLAAYTLPFPNAQCALYHAPTNALFIATSGTDSTIIKLPLTPDGLALSGPPTSATIVGSTLSTEIPVQLSHGPAGSIIIKIDDNTNSSQPRMQLIDPNTLAASVFSTNTYFGVAGETGGAYIPELNGVLTVDTLSANYRLFTAGSGGGGIITGPATSPGGSGEKITIIRIPTLPPPCIADTTTTNTNPGDPGYGIPDGNINGADLSYFVEQWLASNITIADVTTTNTNPGDPNYGIPDSTVNGADLSYYVEQWLSGCP